jgi:hypothetical protein
MFHKFRKTTLEHIAGQVGRRLTPGASHVLAQGGKVELAECYEIWSLRSFRSHNRNARLIDLAHRTGFWHHQVRHNGRAEDYVLSKAVGPAVRDWDIKAVMSSHLAGRIDGGITALDESVESDKLSVYLLIVPGYNLVAFWLRLRRRRKTDLDTVFVINKPVWLQTLEEYRSYDEAVFLRALSQERPAHGLPRRIPSFIMG